MEQYSLYLQRATLITLRKFPESKSLSSNTPKSYRRQPRKNLNSSHLKVCFPTDVESVSTHDFRG